MLDKGHNSKEVVNVADLSKILANVTEKVALLKHQIDSGQAIKPSSNKVGNINKFIDNNNNKATYTKEQDTTNPSLLKNVFLYELQKTTTEAMPTVITDDSDYLGTAQLEELLNDIKARAIEMVAENPTVADLITNTVTEATFEADPILNHLDISSPGYALSTFVFLSDVGNTYKRTANDSGVIHISKRNDERIEHRKPLRSCGSKNFAQSLEDILQSKLKEAYHKVKTKVTKDYEKEKSIVEGTLEKEAKKIIKKIKKPKPCKHGKAHKPCNPDKPCNSNQPCIKEVDDPVNSIWENSIHQSTTKSMTQDKYVNIDKIPPTTHNIRNVRSDKLKMKKNQKVKSTCPTSTLSTVDDFAMLTLYEQILSKTHESNLMKLMATNSRRTNEATRLSKRNPETLLDLRLKRDVKRKYDDEDNMPDADPSSLDSETTETQVQGTSLDALRDKIAFKEYVNGYKSYLDFQKEHGTDKFSNLVKYQAHKHHKVEDIGKFILDKIPSVPLKDVTKRIKRRDIVDFDVEKNKVLDDLVAPTLSYSWFKKYFSIFERNPPSKFRTSETVKFKEVTDAQEMNTSPVIGHSAAPPLATKKSWGMIKGNDINLDELSKHLESNKHKPSLANLQFFTSTRLPSTRNRFDNSGEIQPRYKVHKPNPANSQLFGKRRNIKPTDINQKVQNKSPKFSEGDNFLFQTNRRRKRKLMKTTQKIIDNDEKIIKSKINRDGYVTLVTQPTAIVNLMNTKDGESKIKKLLSKLHLHRNKKKRKNMKKEKRYCTRVQRFSPIKKLRNMFSAREMNEPKKTVADYDMITSHIDTFKAVRYDKLPSMEELQKQIPNISEGSYLNVTDNPGITEAIDGSKTINAYDSMYKGVPKKNHERKVLATPKTFTVVLDPYPVHITTEQLKAQKIVPETVSKMLEAASTRESSDKLKSEANELTKNQSNEITKSECNESTNSELEDLYSDYITPFYDLFNHDEKTETNDKIELPNDGNLSTVLHNAIINKINQEYEANSTKPYSYFKYLKNEMPETTRKLDYRDYYPVAKFIDEQADETYSATSTASVKRTPFFSFSDNTMNDQTKVPITVHAKDRNNLITERNLFVEAALKHFENKKTRFEPFYTQPFSELFDSGYRTSSSAYYYDLMSDSITDNDNIMISWPEHTTTAPKYTTQGLNDMQNELKDMRDRLSETDHRVKFINSLNEYSINKNMLNLRTDLSYKYSNEELEDLVRELNKIYLRRMESHRMKNPYREAESSKNNYARNIVKNRKVVKAPVHPKAKSNKQPKQLFNTPIPMTNAQFEKFLRDNNIDVDSVTSSGLFPYPGRAANETEPDPVIPKNKLQFESEYNTLILQNLTDTETVNNMDYLLGKSYAESQIDYLNDLEQNLNNDYNEIVNERRKRMTLRDDTDQALTSRSQYNKAKHHLTSSKPKSHDAKMKMQNELNKLVKPKDDDDFNNNEKLEYVTEPMHPDGIAENFTNILLNALRTLESKTDHSKIDIRPDNSSNSIQLATPVDSYSVEIGLLQDDGHVTKAACKATPAAAQNSATTSNSYMITNSKLVINGKQNLNQYKKNTRHKVQIRQAPETDIVEILEVVEAVDDFTRPEVAIHIDLPVYYAPNNEIDVVEIRPLKKPSWTDLVIKYVSGIALIDMLSKLDILKSLNFNESVDLNFDRFKVSTADGVEVENSRDKRTALHSKLPTTHVENIHFLPTGPISKNKRMFEWPFKGKAKATTKTKATQSSKTQKTEIAGAKETSSVAPTAFKGKAKATTKTKATQSSKTQKTEIAGAKETSSVAPTVRHKQTMAEAKNILDNKLRASRSEQPTTTTAMPFTWPEQSTEKSIDEIISDLWDYTTEEATSTVFASWQIDQEVKGTADEAIHLGAEPAGATASTIDSTTAFDDENSSTTGVTYKILKRDVDGELRVAKGVAALEIIVDLMKNKYEETSKQTDTKLLAADAGESDDDIFTFRPPLNEPSSGSTNSIQVHIAIPYDNPLIKKRSAEPILARKVFSARLATPVDLEYQIHYIDSIKPSRGQTPSTTNQAEIVSPGLYLLVDNFNEGNNSFALKPVKISSGTYDVDALTAEKKARTASTGDETGLKLSKAFLKAVNKHIVDLYNNITESNLTKRSTHVKREVVHPKYLRKVRDIFGNDRACDCKCKVNEPMCGVCAASDAVIKELSFEFDNLSKYMSDHCTEIQTYFKMNPRGGKVLRDCIRKLDKSLDDYSKRNKGKCHGPTCKNFGTYLHKRHYNHNSITEEANFVNNVTSLSKNFYALSNLIPYVEALKKNGDTFIRSAKDCLVANVKKRNCRDAMHKDDVYTFDNISVKFICNPESTSDANKMPPFDTSATDLMYMDYGFQKQSHKPKLLNKFFSRKKKQNNKSYSKKIMHKKRQVDQVESPLIADAGGSFWRDYILRKTTPKPDIVISVVESNNDVKDRTTKKARQEYSGKTEIADTSSYNMGDLIAAAKTGDQESRSTLTTMNWKLWTKKKKKTKPTKKSNKKKGKLHKKIKAKIYNNSVKQQNEANAQYNMSQYNMTKPNLGYMVTDITKHTNSEKPTTQNNNYTLAIIPRKTSVANPFRKKIQFATANFLKKMKNTEEGYELDLGDFMGEDEQREKRTEGTLTTKKSLQFISQQTVTGTGKPRFVVVTKPISLSANKQSKINNCKNKVLSMLNLEKKNKENEEEENLIGNFADDFSIAEGNDEPQFDETKLTTPGNSIKSWFQIKNWNGSIPAIEQLEKKSQDDTYYDVFEELKTPPEAEAGSSPAVRQQGTNKGKKKVGFLAKNLKFVLRPSVKSMSTFAPDAAKEHEHKERTITTKITATTLANVESKTVSTSTSLAEKKHKHAETTKITDATLANVEEADPFKTRVAEMSSSAFVADPCSNSRCHYNIDKRDNSRQQDHNDVYREKENNPDLNQRYDIVRIYRRTNLRNLNGVNGRHFGKPAVKMKFDRPGFDSYVRGDHGDYRIERDRRKTSTTSHVYVEKKMRKRSSSKMNTDLSSLSGWVQRVRMSRFLATMLCFYLCCVALAAAVSRAFRT